MQSNPIVRPASDVDISCAKPGCRHCGGRGIVAYRTIKEERIPIVCRCVTRRNGLKDNALDRTLGRITRAIADGTYGTQLAAEVRSLPADQIQAATERIERHYRTPKMHEPLRVELGKALDALRKKDHGDAAY